MLLTADGRRAGAISGGCLEAEVASRAWWLTAHGSTIQQYSTADDDGDRPFGSGCGGVVFLLLERRVTAAPLLVALQQAFDQRSALSVATVLEGPRLGRRAFAGLEQDVLERLRAMDSRLESHDALLGPREALSDALQALAERSLASREPAEASIADADKTVRAWADYRVPRPTLGIFGAGDDARPLHSLAKELGWYVTVADGRSHLASRERFMHADELYTLPINDLPGDLSGLALREALPVFASLHREDAAVVMTHSFEQDAKIIACLLRLEAPPFYIGVLGPQRRTRELLVEAARLLNVPEGAIPAQADHWLDQVYAPTGLDLGAESPEAIALSILAEIQKTRSALRQVRTSAVTAGG
jgi:xanthine/CO dehydrogenase XdhC/CoxF family maturation factor